MIALEFSSLYEDLTRLTTHAGTGSRVRRLPENLSIKGLGLMDKLNISPFAPWHYLTYHKPFYFESSYVYEELEFMPEVEYCMLDRVIRFIHKPAKCLTLIESINTS